MSKLILTILCLVTFVALKGQNENVVKCSASFSSSCCRGCNTRTVDYVNIYEDGNHRTTLNRLDPDNTWSSTYIEVQNNASLEYRFTNPINWYWEWGSCGFLCWGWNKYNTEANIVYSYDAIVNNVEFVPSNIFKHETNGINWHVVTVNMEAETYDPVKIEKIDYGSQTDDSGNNKCVTSENGLMTFTLSVANYENPTLFIEAFLKSGSSQEFIQRINVGGFEPTKEVSFSSFNLQNYYGEEILFRVRTDYPGANIYSEFTGVYSFFREMPPIEDVEVLRNACNEDIIYARLAQSVINTIQNYHFRAKDPNVAETTSNIIHLQPGTPEGNLIPLTVTENSIAHFNLNGGTYKLQVFGTELDSDTNSEKISCATTFDFNIISKPLKLTLSYQLTPYTFNSKTYHVSSAGASDGEALLSVQEGLETRIDHYEYYENGNWYTIPADQIETRDGATWYVGLSAGTYRVRVVDTDGCESAHVDFTLVEPSPLEITNLDSTLVNCHINNLGEHTDAQIAIHFTGGIGPYRVEVLNEDETTVYSQDVTADNFLEGDAVCHIYTPENLPVGDYRVVVTDNSAIEAEDHIEVTSNPELILSATPIPYDCYGSADGAILLRLENREGLALNYGLNGDSIYRSFVDTAFYSYLTEGIYNAGVVNSRDCKDVVENIEIRQPNQMQINGMASNPVCYNSFEGNITTNVTGGNGEYTYKWSNNETTPNITGLNNGSYTLIVTDTKGCTSEDIYTITPPVAPSANWVETSAVLCTGNTKTLDGGFFTAYQWKKGEEILSDQRYFTLEDAGVYTLELTNEFGCTSTETFTLELSDHPLDAVLLLQDSARVGELVEVIDVTWPIPDSINWYFDKQVDLEDNNEWYQQFSVPEEGLVNVTLRAWYGGCFSDSTKNIVIYYSDEEIDTKKAEAMPLILGCKLWPNPNNGNFSLDVKLNEEAEISVLVYSLQNHTKIFSRSYQGLKKYEIPFQFNGLVTGVYLVIVKAQNEQQSIKFIINK